MQSLYFYDLETSGVSARSSRIMQFAGQRTNFDLEPIGEPDNILIKLTPDILPDPEAILITGITPQMTLSEGLSEVEFLHYFYSNIATKGTIFLGFNSIRFDDEFIRFLNYRNFYDAYEWQWSENRGKWDILDLARMTRALRPDGVEWPFASDGKPTNRLELLAAVNKLEHTSAHDALSDVNATIQIARLIKTKQPKLYDYLFSLRDKKAVSGLVTKAEPFVYSSGSYGSAHLSTTVAVTLCEHPTQKGSFIVYDLRENPEDIITMSPEALAELIASKYKKDNKQPVPFKVLQTNKCPAVAPLSVLDAASENRLQIDTSTIKKNLEALLSVGDFPRHLKKAYELNEVARQTEFIVDVNDVDAQLYDGFFNDQDRSKIRRVRESSPEQLVDLHLDFDDERLAHLLFLYKARQYQHVLSGDEYIKWQDYRNRKLFEGGDSSKFALYINKIKTLLNNPGITDEKKYLLEELQLYGQSLMPAD
jgi:exodeoxyribonuclease-1